MKTTARLVVAMATAAALAAGAACTTNSQEAPSLTGPSEFALSLQMTVTPDVISRDGGSQATVRIVARNESAQPVSGLTVRLDLVMDNTQVDCGRLSAKTLSTDANGVATASYTAPSDSPCLPSDSGGDKVVQILATPLGSNYGSEFARYVNVRLATTGVIRPPSAGDSAPVPSFFFAPSSPQAGQQVMFDGSASTDDGQIVSYEWNWGDGETATSSTPFEQHDYVADGAYTVRLTVVDDSGQRATLAQSITVGTATTPTADFTFSPTAPSINQAIHFDASASSAPAGRTIVEYDWNFGDGTETSTTSRTTTKPGGYTVAGSYLVTLRVTDSAGQTATVTETVTVTTTLADGPTAEFTFSPTNPNTGTLVTFDAAESIAPEGRTITDYLWNFGDIPDQSEVQATGRIATHAYAESFTYTVTLTVIDDAGRSDTVSHTVTVQGTPSNAAFTYTPANPTTATSITFDATGSTAGTGTIVEYIWSYGDGTTFTTTAAVHVKNSSAGLYPTAGSYTVTLTIVTSTGETDSETRTIVIGTP